MKRLTIIAALALSCALVACTSAPAPTPSPTAKPVVTLAPTSTPEPMEDYVPADIPKCKGLKALDKPLKFAWAGIEDMKTESGIWYYYHCDEKPIEVANLFKTKMPNAPFSWLENGWVERPGEGTLGIYFHTARQTWTYAWFLADDAAAGASYLVLSQQDTTPLELPCCK
jgi:hypothetical protein